MECKICKSPSIGFASALLLRKYSVQYFACERCGFIQAESPYWLEEAYSEAIARTDIGLIGRNFKLATLCAAIIPNLFNPRAKFLDYGGGNGMFVRVMRDYGFDFYWYDKFATNQFASGFQGDDRGGYELVTAFEIFEHLVDPVVEITEMFHYSENVLFTTRMLPRWKIKPDEWWYYATDTGQHISLYSRESLKILAGRLGVRFSTNGISLHLLSKSRKADALLTALSFPPLARALAWLSGVRRRSKLNDDYFALTGRRLD